MKPIVLHDEHGAKFIVAMPFLASPRPVVPPPLEIGGWPPNANTLILFAGTFAVPDDNTPSHRYLFVRETVEEIANLLDARTLG